MGSPIVPDSQQRSLQTQWSSNEQAQSSQSQSMDTSQSTSNKSTGQKQSPKIRLSCDACALAKVRCSKHRPRCERCIQSDVDCVYGLSMKYGKGSRERRRQLNAQAQAEAQAKAQAEAKTQASPVTSAFNFQDFWQDSSLTANGTSGGFPTDMSWNASAFPVYTEGGSFSVGPTSLLTPAPTEDFSWMDVDANMDSSTAQPWDNVFNFLNTETMSSLVDAPATSGPSVYNQGRTQHNCYAIAQSTLATLSLSQKTESGMIAPNAAECPSLEDVLRYSKVAIANLEQLLQCPCSADPHILTTVSTIIMRILWWHQVAAGGGQGQNSSSASSASPVSTKSNSPIMHGRTKSVAGSVSQRMSVLSQSLPVNAGPVQIGSYTLDEEDQKPMRLMLLLSNLKKVGRLIETFSLIRQTSSSSASTQMHTMLASCLQSELTQAMRDVELAAKERL